MLCDKISHISALPTTVPFNMADISSKIRKGDTPIKFYRRKYYGKKRTFRFAYAEGILKIHFNRHG